MAVYLKASDSLYYKTINNNLPGEAAAVGIVLSGGTANQQGVILTAGPLIVGATVTVGETYCVSANYGGICPIADVGTGKYLTYLGYASSTTVIRVAINATAVTHA